MAQAVSGDVDVLGTVIEVVEFIWSQKRSASVGSLSAKDSVQLNGMATGFMDLKGELRATNNDICYCIDGTVRSREQCHRFGGRLLGVARYIQGRDVFPTGAALLSAVHLGVGTPLDFIVSYSRRLNATAGFVYCLLNIGTFGVCKGLLFPDEDQVALTGPDSSDRCHAAVCVQ